MACTGVIDRRESMGNFDCRGLHDCRLWRNETEEFGTFKALADLFTNLAIVQYAPLRARLEAAFDLR